MTPPDNRLLSRLAWINVILHVLGLLFAVVVLRPGTAAFDLETRRLYLAQSATAWSLGWAVWLLCGLAQVAFYAELSRHLPEHPHAGHLAVSLAAAGLAVDLLCDVLWIRVIPDLAGRGSAATEVFIALERLALAGGLVVANGLYV